MRILTDEATLREFSRDAGMIQARPLAVHVAESESDVLETLAMAEDRGVPVTPRGGGTSIPSQSVGKGILLIQERRAVSLPDARTAVCEPSVVKADLNRTLSSAGRWMPVDPSSFNACTIGGMVANNSSGSRSLKYGSTIEYVSSMRVAIPGGGVREFKEAKVGDALAEGGVAARVASALMDSRREIEDERPRVTKNSCGYRLERVLHDGLLDLPKLFVGSEGTLGVVTQVSLRTLPKPPERILLVAETSLTELDRAVLAFRKAGPSALELLDKSVFARTGREKRIAPYSRTEDQYLVFCEIETPTSKAREDALERVSSSWAAGTEPLVLESQGDIARAWEVRNETLTVAGEIRDGAKILLPGVEDLTVPPERLGDLVRFMVDAFESRGLQYITYGHAGDANLHMRPLLDPEGPGGRRVLRELMQECFEFVWGMKGSITGEHGDGMLRAEYVRGQYPKTYSVMKAIRRLFDPKETLSPGVKIV